MNVELSITLSRKQEEVIKSCDDINLDYIIAKTGRQSGKSTCALIQGFKWATSKSNLKIGFFMPTYKQCKSLFGKYKTMLVDLIDHQMVSFVGSPDLSITFYNGSTIQFFTAQNDSCRGFSFDYLILDECAFIKDEILSVIMPTIAVSLSKAKGQRGKVLMMSTPKTRNWFFEWCQRREQNIKLITFTSYESERYSQEYLDGIRKITPECIFKNEYLGEFMDAGEGLFKYLPCIKDVTDKVGHTAGLDLGSKQDWTVLTIMNKSGNVICVKKWQHKEYSEIIDLVITTCNEYGKPTIFIETNGVGQMPFEYCRKTYKGSTKSWNTSSTSKNDIIQKLILDFNLCLITIPNNEDVKQELDHFTIQFSATGKPVYSGSNDVHDDHVMSLAICNFNRPKQTNITPTIIKKASRAAM